MFRAIELIGATVVATSSLSGSPVRASCQPSDAGRASAEAGVTEPLGAHPADARASSADAISASGRVRIVIETTLSQKVVTSSHRNRIRP